MNYFELHLGDYARDTAHLSMLEHGAYQRLLHLYYTSEESLPADRVYRLAGARSDADIVAVDNVLADFFTLVDGRWTQKRCEAVLAEYRERQEKAAENGRRGGRPRTKSLPTENQVESDEEPNEKGSVNSENPTLSVENPTLSSGLSNQNQNESLTNPHLATNQLTSSTSNAGARDDPPWWHAEDDPLVVLFATCLASLPPKNAAGQDLRVPETGVRLAVTRARDAAAPLGDEAEVAIRSVMEQFGETYRKTRPGMQAKAWSAILLKWFENKAADWKHGPKPPANQRGSAKVDRRPKYEIDRERAHQALGVAQ